MLKLFLQSYYVAPHCCGCGSRLVHLGEGVLPVSCLVQACLKSQLVTCDYMKCRGGGGGGGGGGYV